jgi:hypothetical protein
MADKKSMMAEAYRRGLLSDDQKSQYEEAIKRGLISDASQTGVEIPERLLRSDGVKFDTETGGWREDLARVVQNMPESARGLVEPILHPIETAKAVGNLGVGVAQKLVPDELTGGKPHPKEVYADEMGEYLTGVAKDPYTAMIKDPMGTALDISGAGLAVSKPLRAAGKISKTAGAAADVLEGASVLGDPIALTKKATVAALPKKTERSIYMSAAKLSQRTGLSTDDIINVAESALNKNIAPTFEGISDAWKKIAENSRQVDSIIDQATEAGRQVLTENVIKYMDDVAEELLPDKRKRNFLTSTVRL